ncbi:uncharacterized protein LOC120251094 [Dioscorea cayenensis subsp. rotundata]|uniref:Uncharacterized protein LOC120251094 n=1 Tax=Dioscorea cayennensis subsp. rotundata TaxID=55577 RepID=A0AB40AKX6_DIOCR|nr:uncharacterized protein LOC120251094 [Dioscorea cayenensis subsp. rotundata]
MAENTRMKELSAKMETVLAVLDQKEEKDRAKEERISLIEQSLASIARCMEALQIQAFQPSSSQSTHIPTEFPSGSDHQLVPTAHMRSVKMDFPRFNGSNALQWIYQAEQFFDYYDVSDAYRLKMASIHFDGPVVPWFQMLQKSGTITSWSVLAKAIESTYGPSLFACPRSSLFKLMQEGTVAEYYDTFTALANRVEGLSNDAMLDCFLSGLQTELQCEVIPWQPDSITKAFSLAKLFEEKHAIGDKGRKIKHGFYPNYSASVKKPVPQLTGNPTPLALPAPPGALPKPPVAASTSTASPPFRKMSYNEMQLRRAKGLCYNCDEIFTPQHKCANRRLLVLQWDDDIQVPEELQFEDDLVVANTLEQEFQSLSLHAMNRRMVSGTLRFTGYINGYSIQILLDGGSDDNFIQPRVAKFLQLPVLPTEAFKVFVGNGSFLQVEGVVENLPLRVQNHIIHLSVFLLPIVGADIIIGTSWLATLGPHIVDYNAMTLQFYLNDEFITLKGDTYFKPHKSSVHQLSRLYSTKSIAACFTLTRAPQLDSATAQSSASSAVSNTMTSTLQFSADMPVQLQNLLLQYQDVFQIPCGLPPYRNYNHKIPLFLGSHREG